MDWKVASEVLDMIAKDPKARDKITVQVALEVRAWVRMNLRLVEEFLD